MNRGMRAFQSVLIPVYLQCQARLDSPTAYLKIKNYARMKRRFSLPAVTLGLAVVYFCTGKLGLSLAFLNASATAVWPPTGIALVALLLNEWGPRGSGIKARRGRQLLV